MRYQLEAWGATTRERVQWSPILPPHLPVRQERKNKDAEVAERVTQDLKKHQDEITHKELQLASIERRIAVLQETLRPLEEQAAFVEMHRKALNDAD
ncbi:hypothetical protein CCP3SC15_820004 [Gammaproteobacteria bacterium]